MPTGSQDKLAHCRGVRRIVHCLNMLLRVQAPDEQYLATVQHGSLLRAKFQFHGAINMETNGVLSKASGRNSRKA